MLHRAVDQHTVPWSSARQAGRRTLRATRRRAALQTLRFTRAPERVRIARTATGDVRNDARGSARDDRSMGARDAAASRLKSTGALLATRSPAGTARVISDRRRRAPPCSAHRLRCVTSACSAWEQPEPRTTRRSGRARRIDPMATCGPRLPNRAVQKMQSVQNLHGARGGERTGCGGREVSRRGTQIARSATRSAADVRQRVSLLGHAAISTLAGCRAFEARLSGARAPPVPDANPT